LNQPEEIELTPATAAAEELEASDVAQSDELEMPDDMALEFKPASDFAATTGAELELPVELAEAASESDLSVLDVPEDFETEEIEATAAEEMPVLDLSGIDLDLEVEETPEAENLTELVEQSEAEALDFNPFAEVPATSDFQSAPELPAEPDVSSGGMPEAEPELESVPAVTAESVIDPELQEEVNTKLDLARAYMEMGDREGAREILQEVLGEGDVQQKAEAEKLMAEAA